MHQVLAARGRVVRGNHGNYFIHVPKLLRKHARLLRHTFAVLGS